MGTDNRYGVILAGGRGTRFWPRSRRRTPKQLIALAGERSLIQETVTRLGPLIPPERIWVLTNELLRDDVIAQLPDVPPGQVIAEPVGRNTAPAIGLAAQLLHTADPDAVLGVFPSDHHIENPDRFRELAEAAFADAERNRHLVVLGIKPRWPETGYGYIEFPDGVAAGSLTASPVVRFREKPNLETARGFVEAGCFYWNAGMFFWRADVILGELKRHLSKTASLLASLPPVTESTFAARLAETFPLTESISIDYAILEKAGRVFGIAADEIGWNDLGSWKALYELLAVGQEANVTRSETLALAATGNYVEAPGKLVALLGVSNLIVVDTPDAILVADRDHAQQVGDIVKLLEEQRKHLL